MKDATIRASSLGELFDCPARWAAKYLEGRTSYTSGRSHLGTALHKGAGLFDQARIEGSPISVEDATDAFVDAIKKPEGEVRWIDVTKDEAIERGVRLTVNYCNDIAPLETYQAVELKCEPLTISMENGVKITLTGQADRVRLVGEHKGISDLKSGTRIVNAKGEVSVDKHVAPLGTYELIEVLVKQTTGEEMLADAQVIALPTKGDPTPRTTTVRRPSRVLLGDENRPGLLHAAARMIEAETFYGNPQSMLCSERFCPAYKTCWWRANDGP
jgi:hypothetical protein